MTPTGDRLTRRRPALIAAAALVVALVLTGAVVAAGRHDNVASTRQEEVAAKGRRVMPFDLDRTTHVFTKLPDGGRQTVTADEGAGSDQVPLIQGHLRAEATAFAAGDFTDPTSIHGADMPGVARLSGAGDRLRITYADTATGAELAFSTADRDLVGAVHAWFDAQVSDHGRHAHQG